MLSASLESLLLDKLEFFVDSHELGLQELVSLDVEVVLDEPLLLFLLLHVVVLELGVLNTCLSVPHDEEQAGDEGTLSDRERNWLNKIPSEPLNVEDAVVTQDKLSSVEHRHQGNSHLVSTLLTSFNGHLLLFQLVKLGFCD